MFSYLWSSEQTDTVDVPKTPSTSSVSTDTSDLADFTPLPAPPPTILTPSMWCVCVSEYYEDPMDCCGRGNTSHEFATYAIVQAHTAEEAKLHFIQKNTRNLTVQVFPYKFGLWMDEHDWFDFPREDTVF